MAKVEFFPRLERRKNYSTKKGGAFYSYAYFRERFQDEIAEDCKERCVYCDSHEDEVGGREAMEIDHFRPYTRAGFEDLKDDPANFHHSCGCCNSLKSDNWPCIVDGLCHDGNVGFIDPFSDFRSDYFEIGSQGEITAKREPASYIIRLLELDRPYLTKLREARILRAELHDVITQQLPILEAAQRGEGDLSREKAVEIGLRFAHLYGLIEMITVEG